MSDFIKYPRTPHLAGSRLQPGDEDAEQIPLSRLAGGSFIWEEKIDGANVAFGFLASGMIQLQSRGHVLRGGGREAQFALFKAWAETHQATFRAALGGRFIVYGEWCYAKHTVFYDALPHYFLEFDVYDREYRQFLSTPVRRALLRDLPIVSAPVVHEGRPATEDAVRQLIRPSLFKSPDWRLRLADTARTCGQRPEQVVRETDSSDLAEGLYLKREEGDRVIGRYKYIRSDFLQSVADTGSDWRERPILPNQLAPGVDIFSGIRL